MNAQPRLLDLFCGGGGAAMGYHRAGFDVTGVDLYPQPRYPFRFIQGDALDYLAAHGHEYDVIHASPPCQRYSRVGKQQHKEYPDLIPDTRALLRVFRTPYIIENVPGAPLEPTVMLCGQMFGLPLYRHRLFETDLPIPQPDHPPHTHPATGTKGWGKSSGAAIQTVTGSNYLADKGRAAMGIDWMPQRLLNQAIPPAYTEHIGQHLLSLMRDS